MSTNYPTSVDSFPIHADNTNEKIAAATVNNLQDSVVAIENVVGISGNLTTTSKIVVTAINENKAALDSVIGKDNTTIVETKSMRLETDTRTASLTYDANGVLTKVEEKNGTTIIKTTNLTYDANGVLTKVDEIANGKTVTTNLVYTSGVLTGTTKAVV